MRRCRRALAVLLGVFALANAFGPARAQQARYQLSHATVVDQFGKEWRFSPDVVGDRVVVVGFTWLGCTSVCPITDQIMKAAEQRLKARGRPYRLITLTLDPLGDPPSRMAERARQFGAGSSWLWLSGGFNHMRSILSGLNAVEPNLAAHAPAFLVIDGRNKVVARLDGAPRPEEIIAKLDQMVATRG